MLEPVCRPTSAMFVSRWPAMKPSPPTIARTALVFESSDTIAASNPWVFAGSWLRATSAADCRLESSVVWMRSPPRKSRLYRS